MTRKGMVVCLVLLILACAAGASWYLWQRHGEEEKSEGLLVERTLNRDVAI